MAHDPASDKYLKAFLAPAKDLVKQFGVALEIVQDLRWSEGGLDILDEPGLVGRRVDPVRNAIHALNHFPGRVESTKSMNKRAALGCGALAAIPVG